MPSEADRKDFQRRNGSQAGGGAFPIKKFPSFAETLAPRSPKERQKYEELDEGFEKWRKALVPQTSETLIRETPGSTQTGRTAGKDGVSVVAASVDSDGNLILTLSNGSTINAGRVVGADGTDGVDGLPGIGVELDITAAEAITKGDVVTADGFKASSATLAHMNKAVGVAKADIALGATGKVIPIGEVTNMAWAWTAGQKVFLNGGSLSVTPPATGWSQKVGVAKTATVLIVHMTTPVRL